MKTILLAIFVIAVITLTVAPRCSYAQLVKGDTMYVNPNPIGNLNNIILGDTTSTGQRADSNRVYVLTGGTSDTSVYYFDNSIPMYNNITIVGKPDPATGVLPVIAPIYNVDGNIPNTFLPVFGTHVTATLKNLFFDCETPDSVMQTSLIGYLAADSCTLKVDHCIFSNMWSTNMNVLATGGNWDNMIVTNSEFRDVQSSNLHGAGAAWYVGGHPSDSIVFVNNTLFCTERAIVGVPAYCANLIINHNTIFCTADPALVMPQAYHAVITNNIWYSDFAAGVDSAYMNNGDYNVTNRIPAIILVGPLTSLLSPPYSLTEAQRKDTVMNNAYYWNGSLYKLWTAISDTAKHDPGLLTRPVWMDSITTNMFTDKSKWPLLYMANNDSVDPDFNSTLVTSTIDSMETWINLVWSNKTSGSYLYSQYPLNPTTIFSQIPSNWASKQNYPVPENLSYSNPALTSAGTDGFALGDLNWFPAQWKLFESGKVNAIQTPIHQVPAQFSLSQNYPNPFNPSTNIKFSLRQAGVMSLKIYNVLGQLVDVVAQGYKPAGVYTYNVMMDQFASGVYFYTLRQGSNVVTKKMLLLK